MAKVSLLQARDSRIPFTDQIWAEARDHREAQDYVRRTLGCGPSFNEYDWRADREMREAEDSARALIQELSPVDIAPSLNRHARLRIV
jgi:hypothetical protein